MPASIAYAALLRGINVGGVKLLMTDLARLCAGEGLDCVKTYIASGNVVFTSQKKEAAVRAALERRLEAHMGKPIPVLVRTAGELAATVAANPFPGVAGNRLLVFFLPDEPPTAFDAAVSAALMAVTSPAVSSERPRSATRLLVSSCFLRTGKRCWFSRSR